jgi:hypothetical protein
MKSPYVNELEPSKVITGSFLVHSKEIRQKRTGELYLSLLLGDRTGDLDAKMWDNVAEVVDGLRARRLRESERADPGLPQPAAADDTQDAAHGGQVRSSSPTISLLPNATPQEMWHRAARGGELAPATHTCEPCSTPCWTTRTSRGVTAWRRPPSRSTTPSWGA